MAEPLPLTATAIDTIEPRRNRIEQSFVDETGARIKGLKLLVSPAGGRVFYYVTRQGKGMRRIRIEEYKREHFESAQRPRLFERMNELKLQRESGETLESQYRKRQRVRKAQEQEQTEAAERPTVKTVVREYLKAISTEYEDPKRRRKNPKFKRSWRQDDSLLMKGILPILGNRIAAEVDRDEFQDALKEVAKRGNVTANRTQAALSACLNWATNQRWKGGRMIPYNPITALPRVGGNEVPRKVVLTTAEITKFWHGIESSYTPTFKIRTKEHTGDPVRVCDPEKAIALKLLLLTGCRRSEVSQAEWSEVDWDEKLWTIPAERTKTKADDFVVPLSDLALELLERLHKWTGTTKFWLPGKRKKGREAFEYTKKPAVMTTLSHALIDARERGAFGDCQVFTAHDLRRTMRTHIVRLGVSRDIAERLLNHAVGNRIENTYARYEYLDEKREALQKWGRYVSDLVGEGGQVVTFDAVNS